MKHFSATDAKNKFGALMEASGNQALVKFIYKNLEAGTFTKNVLDTWLRANTETA